MTDAPLSGGCACGAVRFTAAGGVKFALLCQCRDCQHLTGSGHATFFGTPTEAFSVTGDIRSWSRDAPSGHRVTNFFCPTCGNPIFSRPDRAATLTMVHLGGLDDPAAVAPQKIIYSEEAQPWDLPSLPETPQA